MVQAQNFASGGDGGWMCGRAQVMKSLIGNTPIAVSTGGLGGSVYDNHWINFKDYVVNCDAIDIIAIHSYVSSAP